MRLNGSRSPGRSRRGVTLLEMLVTVALLVLMMTILVAIFRSALGAISAQQAFEQIDQGLRRLDQTLRNDLDGATARFTPPLNPADNLGYFEYIENSHADYQGEDSDDILAFTSKAPEGQPFTGRVWIANNDLANYSGTRSGAVQTVTSDYAEIIYFLRNGNLYRRVLLIAPERRNAISVGPNQSGVAPGDNTFPAGTFPAYIANNALGINYDVSWQGLNDISAHPDPTGGGNAFVPSANGLVGPFAAAGVPIPNTLGDLTNRQNRFGRPRFYNDYGTLVTSSNGSTSVTIGPDGVPDDFNFIGAIDPSTHNPLPPQDGINDYSPTLYPGLFAGTNAPYYSATIFNPYSGSYLNSGNPINFNLVYEPSGEATRVVNYDTMAFPYVYPGMYSKMPGGSNALVATNHPNYGSHHALDPSGNTISAINMLYSSVLTDNHNPLLGGGDSLPVPASNTPTGTTASTWWGMPTWRETMSPAWTDPVLRSNIQGGTNIGTAYQSQNFAQNAGLSWLNPIPLPPMNGSPYPSTTGSPPAPGDPDLAYLAFLDQPYHDNLGNDNSAAINFVMPPTVYQDDLLLTGVRSFDVKAYDNNPQLFNPTNGGLVYPAPPADYFDLGYEADYYLAPASIQLTPPAVLGTFAHEGRIPPLKSDYRIDPQNPYMIAGSASANLGDNNAGVIRLTRTWDTWSTDYTFAPSLPLNPIDPNLTNNYSTTPYPIAQTIPTYPSYPPPYPAPLRGIQIKVRATDARGQYIKSITIREDFTDKL